MSNQSARRYGGPERSLSTGPPPKHESPLEESSADRPPWVIPGAVLLLASASLALYGAALGSLQVVLVEVLIAIAALSVGGFVGFLFGIPRTVRDDRGAPTELPQTNPVGANAGVAAVTLGDEYLPSNSLEQVSDWLTKILIGVGLVEFGQIGGALAGAGEVVGADLAPPVSGVAVLTQVVIVTYAVVGFWVSFLWTRVYYAPIQVRADRGIRARIGSLSRQLSVQQIVSNELARTVFPSAADGVTRAAAGADAAARGFTKSLPEAVKDKLMRFSNSEPQWDSDPVSEIFGALPNAAHGRRMSGSIIAVLNSALLIRLKVERVEGSPLSGEVAFLLHPTYPESIVTIPVQDGGAAETIYAKEWFTVGAIADNGETLLTYDLRQLPGAPEWFKGG